MNKFKVPIKNALFMYSYIWEKVGNRDYTNLSADDDFESSNIYAELFLINIKRILKSGLYKDYTLRCKETKFIKGRIDFISTINNQSLNYGKVYCNYNELGENNIFNQIIKSMAIRLYNSSDINAKNKKRINKIILYFNRVDYIEIKASSFKNLNFNKLNYYYFLMIKICELIFNAQMLSENTGEYKFYDLFNSDENMHNVFELFVNKFYQYELPKEYKVKYQDVLRWNMTGGNNDLLPVMKIDTEIISSDETIILDTKYYKDYGSTNSKKKKFISNNIYQLMSYLNNINVNNKLRGILLYPLPFNGKPINESYDTKVISRTKGVIDTKVQFVTIDLSKDWKDIAYDLLNIIDSEIAKLKKQEFEKL